MDAIQNIMERVSVRQFSDKEISGEHLRIILEAGMAGPSCKNTRDWSFIVVRDKEMLNKMADANGPPATPLRNAQVGILVCGDLTRSFEPSPEFWVVDGSIATQNMILAANALGIGSVWLGTWPHEDRLQAQAELFGLPETQKPHSIIALGYPKHKSYKVKMIWEEDRVHYEKW